MSVTIQFDKPCSVCGGPTTGYVNPTITACAAGDAGVFYPRCKDHGGPPAAIANEIHPERGRLAMHAHIRNGDYTATVYPSLIEVRISDGDTVSLDCQALAALAIAHRRVVGQDWYDRLETEPCLLNDIRTE